MESPQDAKFLTQILLGRGPNGYEAISGSDADETFYKQEHETQQAKLTRSCPSHLWPKGSYTTSCPRPVLINKQHRQQLQELSDALVASVTDIVDRWWFDTAAELPKRMPLGQKEQEILKHAEWQSIKGNLSHYSSCRGSWRPDFLVEEVRNEDGTAVENFRITEINARFSFNGFMHVAYGQSALDDTGMEQHGLVSATGAKEVVDGLFALFRPDRPLHLLKGQEAGIDIHMFVEAARRRLGSAPRVVDPADLRLVKDAGSKSGFTLCAVLNKKPERGAAFPDVSSMFFASDGELVEEIYQVGLELHQRELLALSPEMLREISLRCFNDMRTILLVHDKRMLGIVKQELEKQVILNVLSPRQAEILDKGIVDTFLPGSLQLQKLLLRSEQCPDLHREYILKPIRSGKGDGIVFGEDLPKEEWLAALERQLSPELGLENSCVVQRRIFPRLYDVVLDPSGERQRCPLVGTYHIVNGVFLGLGIWRSSNDRVCAVSHGGAWMCSVVCKDSH
ncbi:hypothetical protein Trco_007438 [Trichoderma cornu-damae]|uniref:Uncharacterized protein n=1 Tax=Trichoderma cornu-damae TaxID=654480 RepID=A0A9P8QK19_9HYPO|nr:hypothetical protein Trco_007438 [Trichoderma cornu-damae]